MTFTMKMMEEREEGRKEGEAHGIAKSYISSIKSLISKLKISADEAMDMIDVPLEQRAKYKLQLSN